MPMELAIGLGISMGGKLPFSGPLPPASANYAMLSHPSYWTSDASHAVPCAAGDLIQWWRDAVTNVWYQQPTAGSRAVARQDAGGKWYAEFTGTQQHPWVDLSAFSSVNCTLAAAYRIYAAGSFCMFISNAPNSSTAVRELRLNSNTLRVQGITSNSAGVLTDPVDDLVNIDYRHIGTFGNGTNATTLYNNGTQAVQANDTQTGSFAANTMIGGRVGTTSFNFNGRVYGVLISLSNTINVASWDTALHGYCAP